MNDERVLFVLRPSSFVRSRLCIKNDSDGIGRARGLRREEVVDAGQVAARAPVPYPLSPVPCRIPIEQELLPLGIGKEWQVGDMLIGVGENTVEQRLEMPRHPCKSGRFEQV